MLEKFENQKLFNFFNHYLLLWYMTSFLGFNFESWKPNIYIPYLHSILTLNIYT